MLAPAALGTKYIWNSPYFSLSSKTGFTQSLLSSSNNNIFNKGFSNNNSCSSILMHPTQSPIKNWSDLGRRACAVWPHARQSVVNGWVHHVCQCKKSAKNGCSVTIWLGLNIILNTLFSNSISLCSSLNVSDQVSHSQNNSQNYNSVYLNL